MMFSFAWRWSSLTQALALSRDDCMVKLVSENSDMPEGPGVRTYGLCNVVDDNSAVGVAVVHGGQGLVALLAGGIPDFKLDSGGLIEGDGLGEERGADGGFAERVELILRKGQRLPTGTQTAWLRAYLDKS